MPCFLVQKRRRVDSVLPLGGGPHEACQRTTKGFARNKRLLLCMRKVSSACSAPDRSRPCCPSLFRPVFRSLFWRASSSSCASSRFLRRALPLRLVMSRRSSLPVVGRVHPTRGKHPSFFQLRSLKTSTSSEDLRGLCVAGRFPLRLPHRKLFSRKPRQTQKNECV